MMQTSADWQGLSVPVSIALEKGRWCTICAVFPAKYKIDPVFWRSTTPGTEAGRIAVDIERVFATNAFKGKPKPAVVLVGIAADVFFTALSGRLFGDDPGDASGETAAVFRLALPLLPGGLPLDDLLAVVGRFKQGAQPLLGLGRVPQRMMEDFGRPLPLPDLSGAFDVESNGELDGLLEALVACPSGHSAYSHAPALTNKGVPFEK